MPRTKRQLLNLRVGGWWLVATRPEQIRRGERVVLPAGHVGFVTEVTRRQMQRGARVVVGQGEPVFYPLNVIAPLVDGEK